MLKIRHATLIGSALSGSIAQLLLASAALANPLSGVATTGSVSIANTTNKTTVNQKSEDVVIDWSSFNIGAGQTTQFVQPNAQAIAVNRIGGNSASQILGTLDANGRIVLINGNGMLFGKGSQVNVGSLVATSTGGSDSDVLSGKFTQAGNQNAAIVNQGNIRTSQGGLVALVAPSVTNAGTVNAKFGTVAVGAANKFTVDFTGDGLVSFAAQGDVNGKASAINTGSLAGASVSLTAHAAEGVATGVVGMSGIVTAETARNVGGTILLDAGNGALSMTGTLNAAGQTGGGAIETSGNQVAISGSITAGKNGNWKVDPENLTINASAATSIDGALNSGTSVVEQTTSGAASGYGTQSAGLGDIIVASALSWNTSATLTLDSYHSIDINAPITVAGGGGLVLKTNDGGTGGDYVFSNGASVTYPGGASTGASFTLNGTSYDLLYSMSAVQAINASNAALQDDYALANSLNASGTTGWTPLGTNGANNILNSGNGFSGTFAGLGNTISNLSVSQPAATYVGLFGYAGSGATIRDLGLTNESVLGGSDVGGLVGETDSAVLSNDYTSGSVANDYNTGAAIVAVGGLVGYNGGLISNSYSTASADTTTDQGSTNEIVAGSLAGYNAQTIVDSYATGAVNAYAKNSKINESLGGLVGYNDATLSGDYATGSINTTGTAGGHKYAGGLAGTNAGDITDSFSTASVHSTVTKDNELAEAGFVAVNNGAISDSYAMGVVYNTGSAVPGSGFVASGSGSVVNSYWDTQTSGVAASNIGTGVTTAQLMGSLPTGFSASAWGTGPDLLPYLLWQYPNGAPQAISGYAYKDDGTTVLAPTVGEPTLVSALVNGVSVGPVGTFADGFYYFQLAPGTISGSGSGVLVYTVQNTSTGATNGALLQAATGSLDFLNLWGGQFIAPTSDTTYTLASQTSLQTQDAALLAQAEGSNTAAQSLVSGLTYYGYLATGASFTIDEPLDLTDGLYVQTMAANAGITVADAMTLTNGGKLRLDATGNLAVDAAIGTSGLIGLSSGGTTTLGAGLTGTAGITINSGGNLNVDKKLTSTKGTVTLNVNGTIWESGAGLIDAEMLAGSSSGGTTLNGANQIAAIDGFKNKGAGGFTLNDDEALDVDGALSVGTGNLALTATSSISITQLVTTGGTITLRGSNITLDGPISATGNITVDGDAIVIDQGVTSGGTVSVAATGLLTEDNSGFIDAAALTGSSGGAAVLNGANAISDLDFSTGTQDFTLKNTVNLTLSGTMQAAGMVLDNTGSINQTSGALDTATLSGSSVGGANFAGNNLIGKLGAFTNSGAGGFALVNDETLTVGGAVNAGTGNLSLTAMGAGSKMALKAALTAGGTLALNSAGTIAESATDILTAAQLTGSANGTASLSGANQIAGLGNFSDTAGNFSLTDEQALTISGTVNSGAKTQTIQVTSGNLDLTGALDAGTVTLGSSTGEVLGTGAITANLLNVTANTGIDLTGANHITTIGTDQTNSGPNIINNP